RGSTSTCRPTASGSSTRSRPSSSESSSSGSVRAAPRREGLGPPGELDELGPVAERVAPPRGGRHRRDVVEGRVAPVLRVPQEEAEGGDGGGELVVRGGAVERPA